jgi:general secretion pathway protein A
MTKDQNAMQPDQCDGEQTRPWGCNDPAQFAVLSRRQALERLQVAVDDGLPGPLLITGEPGAGKTWLAGRLVDSLPAGWRAVSVDLTSTLDALEFLRLVADALGLPMTERLGVARLRIRAALEDDSTDRRSWLLIVDEAHRGSSEVWEEIHTLAGSLGRAGGFAAMVVLGRTEFARELATRRLDAWAARMSLHLHLMPLDLDEARELLSFYGRAAGLEQFAPHLEELHRDALGNPRMILHLTKSRTQAPRPGRETDASGGRGPRLGSPKLPDRHGSRITRPVETTDEFIPPESSAATAVDLVASRTPSLIPTKPPIRLEEGLVEVGWDGDLEPELTRAEGPPTNRESSSPVGPGLDEQLVDDRYAAMQAWTEWSRNRERSAKPEAPPGGPDLSEPASANPDGSIREGRPGSTGPSSPANVRAGSPHEFAPYSQLFTRLRQSKQG